MDKFLIVGLGNPGAEYDHTRHNTGFMVVDELAKSVGASFEDKRYGFVAETSLKGRKVFILKPTTYMNLSGNAVRYCCRRKISTRQDCSSLWTTSLFRSATSV